MWRLVVPGSLAVRLISTIAAVLLVSATFSEGLTWEQTSLLLGIRADKQDLFRNTQMQDNDANIEAEDKAFNIEYVSSCLWSGIRDVTVMGDYAYCVMDNGHMVVDISNPENLIKTGDVYLGDGRPWDITIWENHAYIADLTY